ncbi:MAG: M28 family peptidase [Solirubrobacterales bacterium]|nr:M28 family peptidase [Solirubrobacterales bacterium]
MAVASRSASTDPAGLQDAVHHLASIHRPSASAGEREAAEWIAERLRALGADARIEEERAHGGYWWPLGLLAGAGAIAGVLARRGGLWRVPGGLLAGVAAHGIADDVGGGRLWFRRRFLPHRPTYNVVAEAGDRDATRTVVLVGHHDAAHTSLLFDPRAGRALNGIPWVLEHVDSTPPLMFPVFGGPALVALGSLLGDRGAVTLGTLLSAATAATMAEIGSRPVVPGANDNLTGVATLLGVAHALQTRPLEGLRVLLVSTGSEESFMEGMQAFARRHFGELDPRRTHVVCVDTVGSPELVLLAGEGMLLMREYPADFSDLVAACAQDEAVPLRRGMRLRNATDGLIALKAGYPTVMLGSVNELKLPDNYHWPTDTAENVDYSTVLDAVKLCDAVVRRLAARAVGSG